MADTGKQSPLGINVLGSILNNKGLTINPVAASYMGESKINGFGGQGIPGVGASGYRFGKLVQETVLRLLTWSIHDAYWRGLVTETVYNNLISIGSGTLEGLGNTRPPTYIPEDPAGIWTTTALMYAAQQGINDALPGPATSGYPIKGKTDQGQQATWYPWNTSNPNKSITQWGWIRCHALQAWNSFNWNGIQVELPHPEYKEFTSSYLTANGWVEYSNQAIMAIKESETFLDGVYSNMSDLISADIAGVNLSSSAFGQDLINLGKAIDLSTIGTFGLPSNLLANLGKNNAITQDLSLALIASGLTNSDIAKISSGNTQGITVEQEQQIYGALLVITGQNLVNVLAPLQCTTTGFMNLADLLNVKKLFPNSYQSMTVPVYNSTQGLPTNSKTYYLIYSGTGVNNQLSSPTIVDYVGVQLPSGPPSITDRAVAPAQYRPLPKGFGSYLKDIIPADQAISAGAFSFTLRQIRNIEYGDFEKFAKVVKGIENTTGLPLTNGTSKPTNQGATDYSRTVCALGMGPYGTYTMSDMFGCMSGLPYPWQLIYDRINELTTTKLKNVYQQNFLAVTWQPAAFTLQQPYWYVVTQPYVSPTVAENPPNPDYDPNQQIPNPDYDPSLPPGPSNPQNIPNPDYNPNQYIGSGGTGGQTTSKYYYSDGGQPQIVDWYYSVNIQQESRGGGYGRGSAPTPDSGVNVYTSGGSIISSSNCGATVSVDIGRDDALAASNGGGDYGRTINEKINNGGPYRWYVGDVQTNWVNKAGQDTTWPGGPIPNSSPEGQPGSGTVIGPSGTTSLPAALLDKDNPELKNADGYVWGTEDGITNRWFYIGGRSSSISLDWTMTNPTWNKEAQQWQFPDGSNANDPNTVYTVLPNGDVIIGSNGSPQLGAGATASPPNLGNQQAGPGNSISGYINPPTPPIYPPRDAAWVEANMPIEGVFIEHPPTATLPVQNNGNVAINGENTPGSVYTRRGIIKQGAQAWPNPMNANVQQYINQANEEITQIQQSNVNVATYLKIYWNLMGTNLKREHRARYTALIPVPVPKDLFLNTYPMSLYSFTDAIPSLSQDTRPHMNAQTIEAISDLTHVGGQSAVAMMRQERNQTRLQELGIRLDNNMPTSLTPVELKTVTTNGTVSTGINGIPSPNGNDYTPPSWPGQPDPTDPGIVITPNPGGIYYPPPGSFPGNPPSGPEYPPPGFRPSPGKRPGDITPIIDGDPNPVVGPVVPTDPIVDPEPSDRPIIIKPPSDSDPNNLPPNLDPDYTGSTLFPSSPTVQQAIDQVIECNCDCWVN